MPYDMKTLGLPLIRIFLCTVFASLTVSLRAGELGSIFAIEGATRLATRPDGTTFAVYAINPFTNNFSYPQVLVGRIPKNSAPTAPFISFATDTENSFNVHFPDVAVNETNGVIAYNDYVEVVYQDTDTYQIGYQSFGTNGMTAAPRAIGGYGEAWLTDDVVPRATMNEAGQFALVWFNQAYEREDTWALARLFNSEGLPISSNFTVNQSPGAYLATVAVAPSGNMIFAWQYQFDLIEGTRPALDIYARLFDTNGMPLANEFRVNRTRNCFHSTPEIAVAADGTFLITWTQTRSDADGIHLQRFDVAGNPVGLETRVSPYRATANQIAMASDGRFIVSWQGSDGDGSGVFAQRFLSDGTNDGPPLWVNEGQAGAQSKPLLGMADDGTFIVKWNVGTNSFARWISWDATNQMPFLGPRVLALFPSLPVAGPLTNATVRFDRSIAPTTFATTNAQLIDPIGRPVAITAVTTSDNQTFTLSFPVQRLGGRYQLKVGPAIADQNGMQMDEDGNGTQGELADVFIGELIVVPTTTASLPYSEDFEAGADVLTGWSFSSFGSGLVSIVSSNSPHSGANHLIFNTPPRGGSSQSAVLAIDLGGQAPGTNLALEFWTGYWLPSPGNFGSWRFFIELSDDANTWHSIFEARRDLTSQLGLYSKYTQYVLDLSAAAATNGVAINGIVYIRFRHESTDSYFGNINQVFIDDVRVVAGADLRGPRIVALTPSRFAASNSAIESLTLTFDKSLDPSTFNNADVLLKNPLGALISNVVVMAVVAASNTQFELVFPAQTLRGKYRVQAGPNIADVNGHLMNQNADVANGDPNDFFSGVVEFDTSAGATADGPVLLAESFENWPSIPGGWSFVTAAAGTISVKSSGASHRGTNHLRLYCPGNGNGGISQSATLSLDLARFAASTNLFLEFWASAFPYGNRSFFVDLSGDGTTWNQVLGTLLPANSTRYEIDVSAALAANGVAPDADVFIRFRAAINYSVYSQADETVFLDDVRLIAGNPSDWQPPTIVNQPTNVIVAVSESAMLSVTAVGTAPLNFQWQFNGTNLASATNSSVVLTNVQPSDSGSYRVVIANSNGSETSSVATLSVVIRPANDAFANRTVLMGASASVTGNNVNATTEPGEPNILAHAGGRSVWWTWTAPMNGRVIISTIGSSFDTLLAVYANDAVTNLVTIAADDDSGGNSTSRVAFDAVAGTVYQITVQGFGSSAAGDIMLNLAFDAAVFSRPMRRSDGAFEIQLRGAVGSTYIVEATSDFSAWIPIATNAVPAGSVLPIIDSAATNFACRFYRAVSQ